MILVLGTKSRLNPPPLHRHPEPPLRGQNTPARRGRREVLLSSFRGVSPRSLVMVRGCLVDKKSSLALAPGNPLISSSPTLPPAHTGALSAAGAIFAKGSAPIDQV